MIVCDRCGGKAEPRYKSVVTTMEHYRPDNPNCRIGDHNNVGTAELCKTCVTALNSKLTAFWRKFMEDELVKQRGYFKENK